MECQSCNSQCQQLQGPDKPDLQWQWSHFAECDWLLRSYNFELQHKPVGRFGFDELSRTNNNKYSVKFVLCH
jgi:hypothetical protein